MGRGTSGLGGSGSGSENSNMVQQLMKKLPSDNDFVFSGFPNLTGSQKQIDWATKLRNDALKDLGGYAITRTSDGKPSNLINIAQKGQKAMADDILNNPLINSIANPTLKQQKIDAQIASYQDLARRIKVLNTIFAHSDSKYWIDNRKNSPDNYLYKKWKKMIDGA